MSVARLGRGQSRERGTGGGGRGEGTLQGALGFAHAQVAGLLQGGEGLVDARDGVLVWLDVEVLDGVADELGGRVAVSIRCDFAPCFALLCWTLTVVGSSSRSIFAAGRGVRVERDLWRVCELGS